jgi:hypothetical protein
MQEPPDLGANQGMEKQDTPHVKQPAPTAKRVYYFWLIKPPLYPNIRYVRFFGGMVGIIFMLLMIGVRQLIAGDRSGLFVFVIIAPLIVVLLMLCADFRELRLWELDKTVHKKYKS